MRYAVLPARGGSKRIPRKNVREFLGRPVIAYALETLKRSNLFDHVIVSTDDGEVADVARQYGAEVPFVRPADLSDDHASTDAVLIHAAQEVQRRHGTGDQACCVYPVNPLLTTDILNKGLNLMIEHSAPTAFPVVRFDFPIEQAIVLDGAHARFRWPELVDARSQDLPVHYHDAGMFYWFVPECLIASGRLFAEGSVVFEVAPKQCQDVNTLEDWQLAELKYLRLHPAPR